MRRVTVIGDNLDVLVIRNPASERVPSTRGLELRGCFQDKTDIRQSMSEIHAVVSAPVGRFQTCRCQEGWLVLSIAYSMECSPSLFRSEPMSYISMYMEADAAHDVVRELGRLKLVEFRDLNADASAFHRAYVNEIKRCEEMERKLRTLEDALSTNDITPVALGPSPLSLQDLEAQIEEWVNEVGEAIQHCEELQKTLAATSEEKAVIEKCERIYHTAPQQQSDTEELDVEPNATELLLPRTEDARFAVGRINYVCGCIASHAVPTFERIIFRATHGNCFMKFEPLPIPILDRKSGKLVEKTVFMAFYSGSVVGRKLTRIAESFGAALHRFPNSGIERTTHLNNLSSHIAEVQTVLRRTADTRNKLLRDVAQLLVSAKSKVSQEKSIFHVLNMFERASGRKGMHSEGWSPTSSIPFLRSTVDRIARSKNAPRPIVDEVKAVVGTCTDHGQGDGHITPTHFHTNKLTSGFQAIVDAYGVANYQEFNPMPFTVITFPFLFAVMFGDFGHGCLMFIFALFLLFKEKHFLANPPGEIFAICFAGRYVILLMSLFSMYTGLIYNDTFAMSFDWLGSETYHAVCDKLGLHGCELYHFDKYDLSDDPQRCPHGPCIQVLQPGAPTYPFGIDPIWKQAENELSFTNSLKMKLSIVLGVSQMLFGVLLSGLNHLHFRNYISLIHEFIPQLIFLSSVFGFMVLVIIIKWTTYYENTHCAPSILTLFIDMFLGFGTVVSEKGCESHAELIPGQSFVERGLIILAFISVPWMLLAKPLLLRAKHTRALSYQMCQDAVPLTEVLDSHDPTPAPGSAHFDFAEEMVHQIIHTIEFVLGTISNTASYLRLWALSLAHAQLSTVFWEKVMVDNMQSGNVVVIMVAFMVWVLCTFAVLMVMESLSAFLHALRLHWVEFQNKFYRGTGVAFQPFKLEQ